MAPIGLERNRVRLASYDARWPDLFGVEAAALRDIQLKRELAAKYPEDRLAYTDAKDSFVASAPGVF